MTPTTWASPTVQSRKSLGERFVEKYVTNLNTGCWEWLASAVGNGYAEFNGVRAHRFSYEWFVGPIPDGLVIDHLCRNRMCVNPAHLEAVTNRENILRGFRHRHADTHCIRGHKFDAENTLHSGGKRYCRTCMRMRDARRVPRNRAARAVSS